MTAFLLNDRKLSFEDEGAEALPIWAVSPDGLNEATLPEDVLTWARHANFDAASGAVLLVPAQDGSLKGALFGLGQKPDDNPYISGKLARSLPKGHWQLSYNESSFDDFYLGFGLGAYKFDRYLKSKAPDIKLAVKRDAKLDEIERLLAGTFLARDLINIPTNDMGPNELEQVFMDVAAHYGAKTNVISGTDLLEQNFPLIHTVGRASQSAPRLLEMNWGKKSDPSVTLVGKGVCFDTGGLDIKPASAMGLMKKDMGGAANVLGLALMVMDANLPVKLRVLIPAVENSISSNAFRPGDILTARNGLTIQVDNTDAEGRLVLADALSYACEQDPELVIDMATLTGAARVALGPDLPPFYTDNEKLASEISYASGTQNDPVWRMPLYKGYEKDVTTRISDLTNAPSGGFAGSITAALFLKRFVSEKTSWAHFDIYGWNPKERPHSHIGGEAQAIRALYQLLKNRYV